MPFFKKKYVKGGKKIRAKIKGARLGGQTPFTKRGDLHTPVAFTQGGKGVYFQMTLLSHLETVPAVCGVRSLTHTHLTQD